jgi:hypothetical protein
MMGEKRGGPRAKTKLSSVQVVTAIKGRNGKLFLAAADLGITTQTLRNYAKRWPEVREAVREAKGRMRDTAESQLFAAIDRGEAWAVCFYLKTQGKRRGYVERSEHRHGGDAKAPPVKVEDTQRRADVQALVDSMPLELRRGLLAFMREKGLKAIPLPPLPNGTAQPAACAGGDGNGHAGHNGDAAPPRPC